MIFLEVRYVSMSFTNLTWVILKHNRMATTYFSKNSCDITYLEILVGYFYLLFFRSQNGYPEFYFSKTLRVHQALFKKMVTETQRADFCG